MKVRARRAEARTGMLAALLAAAALIAGCDGDDEGTPALEGQGNPGEGGTLVWAIPQSVRAVDPLLAGSRSEQLVSRQIHESLVQDLSGPLGDARRLPSLAVRVRSAQGDERWDLELRRGVTFQDGSAFAAAAVLANARRWLSTPAGRRVLPTLVAADAPRPDLVRLFFSRPEPRLPEVLADPRLGIVSPRALRPRSGEGAAITRVQATGTGAFELRERGAGQLLLARNTAWWGTARGLGPALSQIMFRIEPEVSDRLDLLLAGEAQVAEELGAQQAKIAGEDPLLTTLPGLDGGALGIERSVRGVDSAREVPYLAGAWLTNVRVAE